MIIQIKDTATRRWMDRCQGLASETEKEVGALKKIYRYNDFRIIEGDKKLPGPIYKNKSEEEINNIVDGITWLMKQPRDHKYSDKAMHVMQGKFKQHRRI
jgi:hypothetical protein